MNKSSSRLKEIRIARKLTQNDIAKVLGITIGAYSFYERGTTEPSIEALITLSKFYSVSVDYLLGLTDQPHYDYIIKLYNSLSLSDKSFFVDLLKRLANVE